MDEREKEIWSAEVADLPGRIARPDRAGLQTQVFWHKARLESSQAHSTHSERLIRLITAALGACPLHLQWRNLGGLQQDRESWHFNSCISELFNIYWAPISSNKLVFEEWNYINQSKPSPGRASAPLPETVFLSFPSLPLDYSFSETRKLLLFTILGPPSVSNTMLHT